MYRFEQLLYEHPDRDDLNDAWWDLVERIQLIGRPPGCDEPDRAAKIYVAIAPVYYHNYVLGALIAAQLRHHLEKHVTGSEAFFTSEEAGRHFQKAIFGPGTRNGWAGTVLGATGERLTLDYFAKSLQ